MHTISSWKENRIERNSNPKPQTPPSQNKGTKVIPRGPINVILDTFIENQGIIWLMQYSPPV